MSNANHYSFVALDTNVLRAVGLNLDASWFQELLAICEEAGTPIVVVDISVEEWAHHQSEQNRNDYNEVRRLSRRVSTFCKADVTLADLPSMKSVKQKMISILEAAKIQVIPTSTTGLSAYVDEAVRKKAPFQGGGKGFVDAIILDSIRESARAHSLSSRVLIVTDDSACHNATDRFTEFGVKVEFVGRSGATESVTKSLSIARQEFIRKRDADLLDAAKAHEAEIIAALRSRSIRLSELGPYSTSVAKPKYVGTPERVTAVRPKSVCSVLVYYGMSESIVGENRYRISVSVACDVDLVVSVQQGPESLLGLLAGPSVSIEELESGKPFALPVRRLVFSPPTEKTVTTEMTSSIEGSISREAFENGVVQDFRIEPELTEEQKLLLFADLEVDPSRET